MSETVLEVLAKKNDDWLNMARSFKLSNDESYELVQGMYMKMHEYVDDVSEIMYKDKGVNTFYVYRTLRNLFLSGYHLSGNKGRFKTSKLVYIPYMFGDSEVELEDEDNHNATDKESVNFFISRMELSCSEEMIVNLENKNHEWMFEALYTNLKQDIEGFVKSLGWYDAKMYKLYFDEGMSLRKIVKETGISLKSVWLTVKSIKQKIHSEFGEDYIRFLEIKQDNI